MSKILEVLMYELIKKRSRYLMEWEKIRLCCVSRGIVELTPSKY